MCDFVHNLSRNPVALQVAEKVALCNITFRFVPFFISPTHSTFRKATSTTSAFQHCQSGILIAMATCTNKEITTGSGVGATLSLRMAFFITTLTCLILLRWEWPSFLTTQ